MPVDIDGTHYFSASEIEKELSVSRTTFWRWRADAEVPSGSKFRGRKLLFTQEEFAEIRAFANRVVPVEGTNQNQLKLFNGAR